MVCCLLVVWYLALFHQRNGDIILIWKDFCEDYKFVTIIQTFSDTVWLLNKWQLVPFIILSILKEINPEYLLEGLMLKLKLQYFGHLMQRASSLEKILMLGKNEGGRRRGRQRTKMVGQHYRLNGHKFEQAPGDGEGQGSLACCNPWCHKELDSNQQLNNNNNAFYQED